MESWHKTFKKQYLGHVRDLHPDDLVFLLQGSVDIDFRMTYYKISHGLQPITLSEYAATRKAKVVALPFVDAKDMVTEMSQDRKVSLFQRLFLVLIAGVIISVPFSNFFFPYVVFSQFFLFVQ